MIVSDQHQFVFVAIPKTGTRSIYNICQRQYGFKIYKEHCEIVPEVYQDYKKFTIVRNPYDRFLSMWWSTCIRPDDRGAAGAVKKTVNGSKDLHDLLKYLCIKNDDDFGPGKLFTRQCDYLDCTSFDYILHTENLQEEFSTLPFLDKEKNNSLGNINSTRSKWKKNVEVRNTDPWEYIDQESLDMINEYYKQDFELLPEYTKINSCPNTHEN